MTETINIDKITIASLIPSPLINSTFDGQVWNCDLSFQKGTHYLITADSGKGKSTLLNIIYGIRKDYTGQVFFDQIPLNSDIDFNSFRQSSIAYLFQDLRLFGQLTARENILLKPGCYFTNAEIDFFAEKMGVGAQLDKPCNKLSLGQQQRIAIIRAVSQPFSWLLLDEPFSHMDSKNASIAMEIILDFTAKQNAGIIATSLGSNEGFHNFNSIKL